MVNTTARPLAKSFEDLGREHFRSSWPGTEAVMAELAKAMAATALAGAGDGTPLRLESLDNTMTNVLVENDHLKLFNAISRAPASQLVFQWNRRLGRGTTRGQIGFPEGGAPGGGVGAWQRNTAQIMYLGTKRGYTHQLMTMGQMGGTQIDPVVEENTNGTLVLLEELERNIMFSNGNIKSEAGVTVNYSGLLPQLTALYPNHVIDKEGKPLDFIDLEEAGERFVTNGKLLNLGRIRTYWSPYVLTDLQMLKESAQRITMGTSVPDGYMSGVPLTGHKTRRGVLNLEDSIMLERVPNNAPLSASDAGVTLLKPATALVVVAADVTSKMESGTDYYFASTLADKGETDVVASAAVASVVGNKNTVTVKNVTNAAGYRLYRGKQASGADAKWIADLPQSANGADDVAYVDLNQQRPGTGYGVMLSTATEDLMIAQLAPLFRFPLAIVSTTIEFLLMLYHTLILKAGERCIIYKNIGRRQPA